MEKVLDPPDYNFCPYCGNNLTEISVENKVRKYCTKDKWTYFPAVHTAVVAVIERNGKVALVQRNREPFKESWMFPAGFVDYGEHPKDALIREVREEVGLELTSSELFDFWLATEDPRSPGLYLFIYKASIENDNMTNNDPLENKNVGWFELEKLPYIAWRSHKRIVKEVFSIDVE